MMTAVASLVAFAVSVAAVCVLERRGGAIGLLDVPNDRSLHVDPRPRGGGIGILVGVGAALLALGWSGVHIDSAVGLVLAASLAIALTGLWDDIRRLPVLPRLVTQIAMALILVWSLGPFTTLPLPRPFNVPLGLMSTPLTVAWVVGVTNCVNFMDGADGLAGGQATLSLALLGWAAWPSSVAPVALVAAAATAGFLVRNWAPARIFLGDVGSAWLGFVLAALPLAAPARSRESLVLTIAVSLTLFLVDPALTLLRLTWSGHRIGVAHREHAYQRLIRRRGVHAPVVRLLLTGAAALCVMAGLAFVRPTHTWGVIALACVMASVEFWLAGRD
jgi:UDP-N-acetylmuramyl pentapeptide phosphotransferase/UDP-N-acetylglucosamine-1-phosphate transferase